MIKVSKKIGSFLVFFCLVFTLLFALQNVALAFEEGDLVFYDNPDASGDISFTYNSEKSADDNCQTSGTACYEYDNKTKSLLITGFAKPQTRIKVFDDPNGSTNDDYAVIDILPDLPPEGTVVSNFEQSVIRPGYWLKYSRKDGLNGNISHVTIEP